MIYKRLLALALLSVAVLLLATCDLVPATLAVPEVDGTWVLPPDDDEWTFTPPNHFAYLAKSGGRVVYTFGAVTGTYKYVQQDGKDTFGIILAPDIRAEFGGRAIIPGRLIKITYSTPASSRVIRPTEIVQLPDDRLVLKDLDQSGYDRGSFSYYQPPNSTERYLEDLEHAYSKR